jgi:predicted deacylase
MNENNLPIIERLNKLRSEVFSIAKKFDNDPMYRLTKNEERLIASIIPEFGLQVDVNAQSAVFKALAVLETLTQSITLQAIREGKPFDEVWQIATRETELAYCEWLSNIDLPLTSYS